MGRFLYIFFLLATLGCASISQDKPEPFQIGKPAEAPIGCKELRERDPNADC